MPLRRNRKKSPLCRQHLGLGLGAIAGLGIVLALVRLAHNRTSAKAANKRFVLRDEKPLSDEVRRAAYNEIANALATLSASAGPVAPGSVHDARKRMRKVRSLLRLNRTALGEKTFEAENVAVGDIARRLAQARDAHVLVETLDALLKRYPSEIPEGAFVGLRAALETGSDREHRTLGDDLRAPDGVLEEMRKLLARIGDWPLPDDDDRSALTAGAKRIYTRGRIAHEKARKTRKTDDLHRLRRRSKDLRHGVRLAGGDESVVEAAKTLTTVLGDEHDLAVLKDAARQHVVTMNPGHEHLLEDLIARRRKELQREARKLAKDLYAEKPSKAARRIFK